MPPFDDDAQPPQLSPDGLSPAEFEKGRRRKGVREAGTYNDPVTGFGPGRFTLYVPSPAPKTRHVFVAGKPVMESSGSCLDDPAIRTARDSVISSIGRVGPGALRVSVDFLAYVAAVLRVNYDLSDDDLTFLLSGKAWHQPMIVHAFGGEDVLRVISRHAPRLMPQRAPVVPIASPEPAPAQARPVVVKSAVRRILSRLWR